MIMLYELTFQGDQKEQVLSSRFGYSKYCYKFQDQTFNDASVVSSSWDSAVGIVSGYGLDGRGIRVRVPIRAKFFSSPCHPDQFWDPPSLLSNGYWGSLSLGVKWLGCEADHSPLTSVEVKNI
jgi:hypothetical protein